MCAAHRLRPLLWYPICLTALPLIVSAQPDSVSFSESKETGIDTYTFDWFTEAACPPPPTPPCNKDCVCDGVDLAELTESYHAPGLSYVDSNGKPCDPTVLVAAQQPDEHFGQIGEPQPRSND